MITLRDARRKLEYVNTDHIVAAHDDLGELDFSLGPDAKPARARRCGANH